MAAYFGPKGFIRTADKVLIRVFDKDPAYEKVEEKTHAIHETPKKEIGK